MKIQILNIEIDVIEELPTGLSYDKTIYSISKNDTEIIIRLLYDKRIELILININQTKFYIISNETANLIAQCFLLF